MTEQELIQENTKLNGRLQKAVQVFAEQKANIAELTEQLASKDDTIKELNKKLEEVTNTTVSSADSEELEKLKQTYKDLQEKSLVDQLTISSLKKDAEVNADKIKTLTDKVTKAGDSYEEQKATINELNRVVAENNEQLDQITAERDQLKASNESIYSEYSEKIRKLEDELCEANEQIDEFKSTPKVDVEEYENRLEKAKQVFTESKEKIASLSETVNNLVSEKEALAEEMKAKDEEIKTMKAAIKENEPIIKEVNNYKSQMEKLAESAKNKDEETKKSIKLLEESENKRKEEAKKYEAEITRQGTFINKLIEQITGPFADGIKNISKVNDEIQHLYGSFKKG